MTDLTSILAAVADLPPADRVRVSQLLYERYVLGYGLMAPERPLDAKLVQLHMIQTTNPGVMK